MSALASLITELARLPGIGKKTAQRLAYHIVQHQPDRGERLAAALTEVAARVHPCGMCGALSELDPCEICVDPRRDSTVICVVEDAAAVEVVERATNFRGRYLVLGGRISPLDGIGPEELRLPLLESRLTDGVVREVILATNPSLEGEATATWITGMLEGRGLRITRLARGLPVGGDLEYVDGVTLAHAIAARQEIK